MAGKRGKAGRAFSGWLVPTRLETLAIVLLLAGVPSFVKRLRTRSDATWLRQQQLLANVIEVAGLTTARSMGFVSDDPPEQPPLYGGRLHPHRQEPELLARFRLWPTLVVTGWTGDLVLCHTRDRARAARTAAEHGYPRVVAAAGEFVLVARP